MNIFQNNYQKIQQYLQANKLTAYRLYDRTDRSLPVVVDIYVDNAVIHVFEPINDAKIKLIEQDLKDLLNIQNFFYKNRTKNKDLALPKAIPKNIIVEEYGHKFHINLADYLDTGLFLDHRETRKWVQSQSKNKIVLNTFAYTGSFSIYAASGGAEKTYSVDLSKTYCEWIKKNLELNDLPLEQNWVYKMDTLEFFKYAQRKDLRFDIIIIDPPTFSKNKGEHFSVQKDHTRLLNDALLLLNPYGFIVFSNNKTDFKLKEEDLLPCKIEDITNKTMPPDFQNNNAHGGTGNYMKQLQKAPIHTCFLVRKA